MKGNTSCGESPREVSIGTLSADGKLTGTGDSLLEGILYEGKNLCVEISLQWRGTAKYNQGRERCNIT
jgi:hypothetical protein